MWDLIVSVPDHCLSFYFGQLKWESLKKRRKDNRLILLYMYKGLKDKASIPTVTTASV